MLSLLGKKTDEPTSTGLMRGTNSELTWSTISRAAGGATRGTPSTGTATTTASAIGRPSRSLTVAPISAAQAGEARMQAIAMAVSDPATGKLRSGNVAASVGIHER